ncbi:cytochrome-c oxidase, cbb3-type subunit III [Arenimonas caeni]|jgi:cytochrome c oxidase cbb3-type subunit 3|uniref:cytochrome-c oxidase, cbb3-type subunit III n=1 Tax=Arenimonas caeni TaxID=2058085 RepID=UPI002A368F38|nr:cytochrome-c oxidase, cbb3-type subunit III [Arenimonas caeni]MDY0022705.1 cytochrome-c oxidase, cbb3-type subunit III [Arenimonas caeni]
MTTGWSLFVIFLVVLNIGGCAWLLWWTSKRRGDEARNAETTGHVWDGDLTEYNKPLPRWWIILFWLTIAYSVAYLAWYPGMGNFAGTSGWTSAKEHDADKAEADARLAEAFGRFDGMAIDEIAGHPEAVAFGARLFQNYCAQCHGSDARGARGFPNLTDGDWLWGGSPDQILTTILAGRQAAMPPLAAAIGGDIGVTEVTAYVQSLSGIKADPALAAAGQARYAGVCAACHGPEGKGNPILGAPNLTDDTWLYGSDFNSIAEGIRNGRNGMMPAHEPIIGETRSRLVGAYVWSISHGSNEAATEAP